MITKLCMLSERCSVFCQRYLATLSIDKKWLSDDTKIKPGDVVILKPESMEKNQWRLARILNITKPRKANMILLPFGYPVGRS